MLTTAGTSGGGIRPCALPPASFSSGVSPQKWTWRRNSKRRSYTECVQHFVKWWGMTALKWETDKPSPRIGVTARTESSEKLSCLVYQRDRKEKTDKITFLGFKHFSIYQDLIPACFGAWSLEFGGFCLTFFSEATELDTTLLPSPTPIWKGNHSGGRYLEFHFGHVAFNNARRCQKEKTKMPACMERYSGRSRMQSNWFKVER